MLSKIFPSRILMRFLFLELSTHFIWGIVGIIAFLFMIRSFKIMDYILIHGTQIESIIQLLFYMTISLLPVLIPMSLLSASFFVYGRLGRNSELVALKTLGLSVWPLVVPAFFLAFLMMVVSYQVSFELSPRSRYRMKVLSSEIKQSRPPIFIQEGFFLEGFNDLVIYVKEVDSEAEVLKKIFIYDERNADSPFIVVAQEGKILSDTVDKNQNAVLRLEKGFLYSQNEENDIQAYFDSYDMDLFKAAGFVKREKKLSSYTLKEIYEKLENKKLPDQIRQDLTTEVYSRWALIVASFVLTVVGVGLGMTSFYRTSQGGRVVVCLFLFVTYWLLHAGSQSLGGHYLPGAVWVWSPNILFFFIGTYLFKKQFA